MPDHDVGCDADRPLLIHAIAESWHDAKAEQSVIQGVIAADPACVVTHAESKIRKDAEADFEIFPETVHIKHAQGRKDADRITAAVSIHRRSGGGREGDSRL